jgi:hypothetical protein
MGDGGGARLLRDRSENLVNAAIREVATDAIGVDLLAVNRPTVELADQRLHIDFAFLREGDELQQKTSSHFAQIADDKPLDWLLGSGLLSGFHSGVRSILFSLIPHELITHREQAFNFDYSELTIEQVVELVEGEQRRSFLQQALQSVAKR